MMEYPKALYLDGSWKSVNRGLVKTVNDADEEESARAEGYLLLSEGKGPDELNEVSKEPELSKEDLLAEAAELGIEVKGNWGVKKLSEEIAKAKAEKE